MSNAHGPHISKLRLAACSGLLVGCALLFGIITQSPAAAAQNWPQWRGPHMTGVADDADPPLTWSETENLKWKASTPGFGTSTPIVWDDRIFLLTAIPTGKKSEAEAGGKPGMEVHQFVVLCLDRATGKTLWQKTAREVAPHEGHHPDHGFASGSPVTDGQVVIAYFGSRGLHCYDLQGNHKWSKDFGPLKTKNSFGEGSSPALHGNIVVVNRDDESDNDFIVALDKTTGNELWRTPRQEDTGWSTPLIVEHGGKAQVVVNATKMVRAYDLATGKELWSCSGQTANPIPTPVANSDTVFVTSGFRGSALYAIALGKTGDLSGTGAVRWTRNKNTPYVPSPLLAGDFLYTVTGNNGVLSCFDARTGTPHFEGEKLEGISGIYASPVSSRQRVYVLGRDGSCLVLKLGPKLEILARNKIEDKTDASIALVGKELFIRGHKSMYCIGGK